MFKVTVLLLSLFSIGVYAQDTPLASYIEQEREIHDIQSNINSYLESAKFIENYKLVVNSSKAYQLLLTTLITTPDVYEAAMSTISINEKYQTHQKLDELIKTQQRTNALLTELIKRLPNS